MTEYPAVSYGPLPPDVQEPSGNWYINTPNANIIKFEPFVESDAEMDAIRRVLALSDEARKRVLAYLVERFKP